MIHLCHGYSVKISGYDARKKDIMTLIRFKYIRSAFHPENGNSVCGDKYHHLSYFFCMFNEK